MRALLKRISLISGTCALLACGPLIPAPQDTTTYFVIDELEPTKPTTATAPSNAELLVRETQTSRFLNSNKIVFSDDPTKRGYYQLAKWVESPARRISTLLINRLEATAVFSSVAKLGSAALGNYQLNSELSEFYHDIEDRPGRGVIEISVEVLDLKKRNVINRKRFKKALDVKSYNVSGAVDALTLASNQILDEIVAWTLESIASAEEQKRLETE